MQKAPKESENWTGNFGVWKDFSPITDSITSYVPTQLTKGTPITGPYGEQVPYETRRRDGVKKDIFGRLLPPVGYVRVGNLVFIDSRLRAAIPTQTQEEFRDSTIWLSGFRTEMGDYTHLPYAALTIYALATLNLNGKHVLDLGSGDGVLALVAHRMGASRVTLVDLEIGYRKLFQDHLDVNGIPANNFRFVTADITQPETVVGNIDSPVDVVVANIGPIYGKVHLAAIDLLDYLPLVRVFVGGAYIKDHPQMDSAEALIKLGQKGYLHNRREATLNGLNQTFIVDK